MFTGNLWKFSRYYIGRYAKATADFKFIKEDEAKDFED